MKISHELNLKAIDAKIIRGGSSKAVFLDRDDLPEAGPERDAIILGIYGSPDKRQIDGLGGAEKLTSKLAIMGTPTRSDCDIDYLFGQVGIDVPLIDWSANCGNISSGAALYGALAGLGRIEGDVAHVNVHQVNTGRRLRAMVPMRDGAPATEGDFSIAGVPGTGARISLDFSDFAGSATGRGVLPTGNARDIFDVPGVGPIEVSVVDIANLQIVVHARDIGLDVAHGTAELDANRGLLDRLQALRKTVSIEIGFLDPDEADQRLKIGVNPQVAIVSAPTPYKALNGKTVTVEEQDIVARSINFAFHKAYPASGSIGGAIAAGIPGTVANEVSRHTSDANGAYSIRIAHPSGVLTVAAAVKADENGISVERADIDRTARLLMDGRAYFR